jgi:hypothetical protein
MSNLDTQQATADITKPRVNRSKRLPPTLRNSKLQEATRSWLNDDFTWQQPFATTLTLKKGTELNGWIVSGDRIAYSQNLRHFLNVLNRSIFGGMAHAGWQFSVATFFERSHDGLPHFHLVISKPPHLPHGYFAWLINHLWAATTWGRRINEAVPMVSPGWINYITKFKTKEDYDQALELRGTHRCEDHPKVPFKLSMRRHPGFLTDHCRRSAAAARKFMS